MAEPKGGPVKPPILDLKPVRSSTTRSRSAGAPSASAPSGTPKSGAKAASAKSASAKPVSTKTASTRTASTRTASAKPAPKSSARPAARAAKGSETRNRTSSAGSASAEKATTSHDKEPQRKSPASKPESAADSAPMDAKPDALQSTRGQHDSPPPGTPLPGTVKAESDSTSQMPIMLAILGGALLSLLLLIPLIVSGIIRPPANTAITSRISEMENRQTRTEEQIGEALVGFRAINEQFTHLQEQDRSDREQLQTRIDSMERTIATLRTNQQDFAAARAQSDSALEKLSARLSDLEAGLTSINRSVADLPAPFDATPLQQEMASLGARIDAIAAGASTEDAERLSTDVANLQARLEQFDTALQDLGTTTGTRHAATLSALDDMGSRIDELNDQVTSATVAAVANKVAIDRVEQDLNRLNTSLREEAARRDQQAAIRQVQEVPALLTQIEDALNNAEPFFAGLDELQRLRPDLEISEPLVRAAATGLHSPAMLADEFTRAIPDLLAARPIDPDAPFSQRLGEMLQAILAIRPTSSESTDPVQNLVRQAEQAIADEDFSTASMAIEQLPAPMRNVLGDTAIQISLVAQLRDLIDQVRLDPLDPAVPDGATASGTDAPSSSISLEQPDSPPPSSSTEPSAQDPAAAEVAQ